MRYRAEITYRISLDGKAKAENRKEAEHRAQELFDKGWSIILPLEADLQIQKKSFQASDNTMIPSCRFVSGIILPEQMFAVSASGNAVVTAVIAADSKDEAKTGLRKLIKDTAPFVSQNRIPGISPGINLQYTYSCHLVHIKEPEND